MKKLVFTALAIAVSSPAFAGTPLRFERDGLTYVGSIEDRNGVRYISGQEVGSGSTFSLRVSKGWVIGDYAGSRVSFPVPARVDNPN